MLLIAVMAALAVSPAVLAQTPHGNRPASATAPAIDYAGDDAEMNAAMAEARRTLPIFWKLFDSDPVVSGSAKVKMTFTDPATGGLEHLWIRDIRREGGLIKGVVDNQPTGRVGVNKEDPVTIVPARISDWRYIRNGRLYGSYTTRVMVPRLPLDQQALYRRVLSDTPLEDGRP